MNRRGAFAVSLFVSSSLVAREASAAPLVWGSGNWGDTWQNLVSVPSLSPLALWLLAAALAVSVVGALRYRATPVR